MRALLLYYVIPVLVGAPLMTLARRSEPVLFFVACILAGWAAAGLARDIWPPRREASSRVQKRPDLTEVRATFSRYGGTHVERVHHHRGCALDRGVGECNCLPIRTSDFHTPRAKEAS